MKVPADMLLLRERQRKVATVEGPAAPIAGTRVAGPTDKTYYRAFSRVALFGTVVQGRVDHDRLQAALTCTDGTPPARRPMLQVTLFADDLVALERATPEILRAARLADSMSDANEDVNASLRAYRAAALRLAWAQEFMDGREELDRYTFARNELERCNLDRDTRGAELISFLKNLSS